MKKPAEAYRSLHTWTIFKEHSETVVRKTLKKKYIYIKTKWDGEATSHVSCLSFPFLSSTIIFIAVYVCQSPVTCNTCNSIIHTNNLHTNHKEWFFTDSISHASCPGCCVCCSVLVLTYLILTIVIFNYSAFNVLARTTRKQVQCFNKAFWYICHKPKVTNF